MDRYLTQTVGTLMLRNIEKLVTRFVSQQSIYDINPYRAVMLIETDEIVVKFEPTIHHSREWSYSPKENWIASQCALQTRLQLQRRLYPAFYPKLKPLTDAAIRDARPLLAEIKCRKDSRQRSSLGGERQYQIQSSVASRPARNSTVWYSMDM